MSAHDGRTEVLNLVAQGARAEDAGVRGREGATRVRPRFDRVDKQKYTGTLLSLHVVQIKSNPVIQIGECMWTYYENTPSRLSGRYQYCPTDDMSSDYLGTLRRARVLAVLWKSAELVD